VAQAVYAAELNISTQRLRETYDLAIATNVLLYFGPNELALALSNTAAMLRTGGYFIHNDLRPQTEEKAEMAGFETLQARSVLVAEGRHAPLYDSFALNRKR
jgi:predicted TPR repeat methyltransferase